MADLVPKVTPIIIFDPQEKSIRSKIQAVKGTFDRTIHFEKDDLEITINDNTYDDLASQLDVAVWGLADGQRNYVDIVGRELSIDYLTGGRVEGASNNSNNIVRKISPLAEEVQAYTQERIEAFRLLDSLRNLAPKYNEKTNISLRKDPKMRVEAAVNAMYLTNTDSPDIENIANAAILYHDDLSTENIDHAVTQYSLSKGQFEDIRQFFDDLDFDETYMGVVDNAIEKLISLMNISNL